MDALNLIRCSNIVVSLALTATLAVGCTSEQIPPDPTEGNAGSSTGTAPNGQYQRVLFSGDSLSDGWYASTEDLGFVKLLTNDLSLREQGAEIFHAHRHGYRLQDVTSEFSVPADLDLAIIELGTNDVRKQTSVNDFTSQYIDYLQEITASSPEVQLICVGVYAKQGDLSEDLDKIIRAKCNAFGGTFVRIRDLYDEENLKGPMGNSTWAGDADLGHPNDAGHAVITKRIENALQP